MRSDVPYTGTGSDGAEPAESTDDPGPADLLQILDIQDPPGVAPPSAFSGWLSGLDEVRALTRRRFHLVGAVPGSRILVVGCGRGGDVLTLARLVRPGGRAFGVDREEANLADARRRAAAAGLAAKFHRGAPDDLPFPDASFDGACAAWLSAGITDPAAALGEMVRAVRPGGRVVVDATDWAAVGLEAGRPEIVARVLAHTARTHVSVDRIARENGLVNRTVTTTPAIDRTGASLRLFAEMANAAAAAGEIGASDAAHLKADLAQAVAQKRFAATLPCVTLAGERP